MRLSLAAYQEPGTSGPLNVAVSADNPLPVTGTFEPPVGGATEAEQELQTAALQAIETAVETIPPVAAGAKGMSKFRAGTAAPLVATTQAVKASAGSVFGVRVQSPATNVLPTYIKFFNAAAGSVTPGTTVPVLVLEVPAFDDPNTGQLLIVPGAYPIEDFSTAISVLATSVLSDSGAQTAPTTGVIAEIHYA